MATHAIDFSKSRTTAGVINAGTSAHEVKVFLDPDQMRSTEYTVYLHSISKRSFEQAHPIYRNIIIPACPKDKRYITFMKIQHPVQIPCVDPDNPSGPNILRISNGIRVALDVCNPNIPGSSLANQDLDIPVEAQIASGEANLTRQGIFASMNETPTEEELKKAEARRVAYYKFRFEEANGLNRSNPKMLQEVLTQDHHLAAEMFGQDVDWHRITTPKIECPNCGEKIKEGIAFHYVNGTRCILDFERAYLAGAIKKEDVPEEMRWWADEEPAKRGPGRPRKEITEAE
jgi:hypothetical protein